MWFLYIGVLLLAIYFLLRKNSSRDERKILPCPTGVPIFGNGFQFDNNTMHFKLSEWAYELGPIYAISVLGQRLIVLSDEDIIRKAMSTEEFRHVFSGRQATFYGEYALFGSQSIAFTNDLDLHSKLRKAFTRGLHFYGEGTKVNENIMIQSTMQTVEHFKNHEGKDFDPTVLIKVALSNIISILLNGKPSNRTEADDDMFWEFTHGVDAALNTNWSLVATSFPFLRFLPGQVKTVFNLLEKSKREITVEYVDKMKATYSPNEVRGLVDFMLHSQAKDRKNGGDVLFSDERIACMVLETVAAGLITSMATIRSFILCMIHNQECQERMYQEILTVIGADRTPMLQDRSNMPYTEAVIYESLRYAPPAPLAIPHLCTKDVDFEGFTLKNGDLIVLNIWHMQHEKSIWSDPFVFRPERFLDDDEGQMLAPGHTLRKNWMPFSIGRRQCIGESLARSRIFLLVTTLFQHFRFLPPAEGDCISNDPRTYRVVGALHPDYFKCRIESR